MGNCLFLRARGWGIDRQVTKKLQIPGGVPRGGGMVTGRIEPCISGTDVARVTAAVLPKCSKYPAHFFSRRVAFSGPKTTLSESEKECLSLITFDVYFWFEKYMLGQL